MKNRVRKNASQESANGGAALLAVCRGKVLIMYIDSVTVCIYQLSLAYALRLPILFQVSEGIDFSDDNARVVVSLAFPYRCMLL